MSSWITAGGAAFSAVLYVCAYLQVRRRFPERAGGYAAAALATAAGATVGQLVSGADPVWIAATPGLVAAACFLAGKGSVAVLVHEGGEDVPDETASAWLRLGVIVAVVLVVGVVWAFVTA